MAGRFSIDVQDQQLLPGRVADYLNTPVIDPANRELLARPDIFEWINNDPFPIPRTDAREGYFGERHLEYWLSGYRDLEPVMSLTGFASLENPRALDFGGASGRIARHFRRWNPKAQVLLSDINPTHVAMVQYVFKGEVDAFLNYGITSLPLADNSLDLITAFSVFTHIHDADVSWLLELRRTLRKGGAIYLTVHDQNTWEILPKSTIGAMCMANAEFRAYYDANPVLPGRVTHFYNENQDYNCNVFVPRCYTDSYWLPLFDSFEFLPLAHDHQTGLLLRVHP